MAVPVLRPFRSSPISRLVLALTQDGLSLFRAPSQAHRSDGQDPELPLDDTHSLAFRQIGDFRFVQVVSREPISKNPRPQLAAVIARFPLLGLIARAMRVGYCAVKGFPHHLDSPTRYPARFFFW